MGSSWITVCPQCGSVNRIPEGRPARKANCGRCGQSLFAGRPVAIADGQFDRHVGRSDIPVLVDFWADWCGPCKMMAPVFDQAAAELEPQVRLAKVNIDQNRDVAARYDIQSVPTMVLFQGGREKARMSGATNLPGLLSWVQNAMHDNPQRG